MVIKMGSKVRLKGVYTLPENPDKLQVGDTIDKVDGRLEIHRNGPRLPNPTIPASSVGIVEEGLYCSGIFDYSRERPVKFENYEELGIAMYFGVPTELLEVIEEHPLADHPSGLWAARY
ncbi:hypothetical protein E3J85_02330 [Patescibacteria group bacterium]|nr:MAG: hypothetical protein E3J85_02330 [Patescibacteria group bacterium]